MRPQDIGLLTTIGEVQLSPDGTKVAYTLKTTDLEVNKYRTRIWLAPLEGGEGPRPVSGGDASDGLPRWSPDGSMLAWVGRRDEGPAIFVAATGGPGQPALVAGWADEISELQWSPRSDRLAFVGRVRDAERYGPPGTTKAEADMPPRRVTRLNSQHNGDGWVFDRRPQVHVVPVDGSSPPLALTDVEAGAGGISWSPDGTRLAYTAATHDTWDLDWINDLWTVDAGGGEPTRLTDTTVRWESPSWSPDERQIAVLGAPRPLEGPRHGQLWVVDPGTGGRVRWAASYDRNLAPYGATRPPVWVDESVVVAAEDHGRVQLLAVGAADHRILVDGDRVVQAFDATPTTLAFAATAATEPSELWVGSLDESGERRLTDHGATFRSRVRLATPERFTAVSTGGAEVECWAIPPVEMQEGTQYPTVLNIHGGPFTQYGYGLFDEFQLQAAAGFGVVYCNPRGSSGYTEAWGRAVRWPEAQLDPGSGWGALDYDDVMACTEEAIKRFVWIDRDRLGVQGGSYGGYMTSWIVGHTDRFRAAVSERACNNLETMEHNSDISGFFKEYVGWTHVERPDLFARQSPMTYVEAMTTPLLLIHSEQDLRCPISQAEELFVALRLLGRNPELVRFPGESHELSRSGSPKHRVMRAEIILDWFQRHLAG